MRLKVEYRKHRLQFLFDARTSRGSMADKITYWLKVSAVEAPYRCGYGECHALEGLSLDAGPDFEANLSHYCHLLENAPSAEAFLADQGLDAFPGILFGFETALRDLQLGGQRKVFDNAFHTGKHALPINGLIWMGNADFMRQQVQEKLAQKYTCIKIKIGALDFEQECALLYDIRKQFSPEQITLRVDANGAFSPGEAMDKLKALAALGIHSIEQPIKAGQWEAMAALCRETPVPIALDEELIPVPRERQGQLLNHICPQYIILKPALMGGFRGSASWIAEAEKRNIGWWITSALEGNIGLNAICQFTAQYPVVLPQGLGTGQLYANNLASPLTVAQGWISYNADKDWELPAF